MACAPFSVLEITDGTTLVNLLAERSGFCCTDWTPAIAEGKGGGVWRDSPLSGGRRLAMRKLGNVIERYELQVRNWNQDQLIRDTQNLRRLLEKAIAYWTTRWQDEPVWIKAQSPLEENPRHALVQDDSTPGDDFPYGQPFWPQIGSAALDSFALLVERGHWTENEPGTGTAVECSAVETYDGRNLGNVDSAGARDPTTADAVFIANKRNEANLTDIYHYTAIGPAWSANLMDAALPFDFLPAVPAVGDITYFGIDTAVADSGPFCSLVFDISTAQVDLTITWEYWNGAWVALTAQDNTDAGGAMTGDPFDTLGVNSVHWVQPSDWATVAVNAITGYWVRARVTAIGGAPAPPQQQNRDIYSIVWPYIEAQSVQVGGDIAALSRVRLNVQSFKDTAPVNVLFLDRTIIGLRSTARGDAFTAYLNCADEQNPASITATIISTCNYQASPVTPTGRYLNYTPVGVEAMGERWRLTFSNAVANDFMGTYHAYIRGSQSGGSVGDIQFRLRAYTSLQGLTYESGIGQFFNAAAAPLNVINQIVDLGMFTIGSDLINEQDDLVNLNLSLYISNSEAGSPGDAHFYDIILVPIDEWAGDFTTITYPRTASDLAETLLDLDSIAYPKQQIRALVRQASTDRIKDIFAPVTNGPAIWQANQKQRYWVFSMYDNSPDDGDWVAYCEIGASIQAQRMARYFSMRGDR